jgi:arylsulfatase A-like enzyme
MNRTTAVDRTIIARESVWKAERSSRLGALDLLLLSVWCGLAGGLLEVGTRILCRTINPTQRLYVMTRHFVWLTPLANLLVFVVVGCALVAIAKLWPRFGLWLGPRLVCTLAILPIFIVAVPHIYPEANFILAFGIAWRLVPLFEGRWRWLRRRLVWSFPGLLVVVMILAGTVFGGDWLKERRELAHELPPAGSPNVLLIVLDTVRADRLSLYGYHRATTPVLERLARQGIRFDLARAPAPWTLASHASFFSGRWPHELGVQFETPLQTQFPMLAEYLGAHGYATAGLVANTVYCSYATGLNRGFTHYEDYILEKLGPLRTAVLIEETRKSILLWLFIGLHGNAGWLHSANEFVATWSGSESRRDAGSINRGLLDWLDHRRDPHRPFFAFLNYFDAHTPYKLPDGATPRFSRRPQSPDELEIIYDNWTNLDKSKLAPYYLTLARDSYDNCLAYLDEMLGQLHNDLGRRGLLERTWIVIVGDHGEGLGEHDLYEHGESLYSTEIRVPLLIVPPSGSQPGASVVREMVSLRDLPATIVDVVGLGTDAPFPGRSLASLWGDTSTRARDDVGREVFSELPEPSRLDSSHGRSPARRGPLVSLAEGDMVYIFNEGDRTEELYNEREDPRELTNLAARPAMLPDLKRFRQRLAELKAAPGVPARRG